MSSTTLHRPCSLGVSSAQAVQLTSPPVQLEELSHPPQDVLLRSQLSSDVQPTSPAAQFDELNHSTQAMQPRSQFSSGRSAHEPTSSVRRAQPPNSGRVTQESTQLRHSAHSASALGAQQLSLKSSTTIHRPCNLGVSSAQAVQLTSPPFQLEELSHTTQDVLLRSQFSSNSYVH